VANPADFATNIGSLRAFLGNGDILFRVKSSVANDTFLKVAKLTKASLAALQ
jgi:hypothetical protein